MLDGKTHVLSKRRSGFETQNFTQAFLGVLVHIGGEIDTRLLTADFLPGELTKRFKNFFNGNTIFLISFGKKHEIIGKKYMREGGAILRSFYGIPKSLMALIFN